MFMMLLLAAALAFLWVCTMILPATILPPRRVIVGIRAGVVVTLLLIALLAYISPVSSISTENTPYQSTTGNLTTHIQSNNLQDTLYSLNQSGASTNPAYTTLLHDYTRYHAVLVIEGSIFSLMLIVLSLYCWQRFGRREYPKTHTWSFEKKAYFYVGLVSSMATLGMLLIVAANLSNTLNPQAGFVQSIPDLGTPAVATHKALLHQAVNTWALSGSSSIPALLQDGVADRLAWQQPKAIICSILLVISALLTTHIWQRLIKNSRTGEAIWSLKEKALTIIGVLAIPVTMLLMIMALANTQASFAPITLTLLFG